LDSTRNCNDHPTHGLALYKNHHGTMDRNLIAPCPDHHWHAHNIHDPRRSNDEKELIKRSEKFYFSRKMKLSTLPRRG
jgi:hypothetical protein